MNVTPTNLGQLHQCATPESDVRASKAPEKQLEMQVQQLAEMRAKAKSSMPSTVPLHSMQQTPSTPASSTSFSAATSDAMQAAATVVNTELVELENHVSMQIFSSPMTQSSDKVVMFLHGGPGLAYDESFKPVTDWFLGHGYTLVAPEIAGSGKTGLRSTSNGYTQNYVRDLKAIVHNLRERPDMQGKEVCVVAHSWGGFQLASLMTDESAEERNFFKQAVFMSSNLDSAQTRLFADVSDYSEQGNGMLLNFERKILSNFTERHAGQAEKIDASEQMTVTHNPLMDQSLNRKFSPFYRLQNIPRQIPCLFIHATDDKQVPVSQSVDAFKRINDAGGDARIVIASRGGHGFFKAGEGHHAETMTHCFDAINNFIHTPEAADKAMIDKARLPQADASHIEESLRETDSAYENAGKMLADFHRGIEVPPKEGAKRIPPKKVLLEKLLKEHEIMVSRFRNNTAPAAVKIRESNEGTIMQIKQALEKNDAFESA